jgi:hypothetical protein
LINLTKAEVVTCQDMTLLILLKWVEIFRVSIRVILPAWARIPINKRIYSSRFNFHFSTTTVKMSCILHKISWTQCRPLSSMFINSSPIWPNLQMQPFGCFSSQSFVAKCQTSKRGTVTSQASVLLHIFPTQLSTKLCGCASHFSTAQSLFKSENVSLRIWDSL